MSMTDELQRLQQLRDTGAITEEEYAAAKAKVLNPPAWNPLASPTSPADTESQTRQWGAILHLSKLLGYSAVPVAGLVAPIIVWQIMKGKLPALDAHGCNATNWLITSFIYYLISGILCLVLIGIPMLIAVAVCDLVFPIIAAMKAYNGEVWKYPMTITFLRPMEEA